jgi:hypothetical protein
MEDRDWPEDASHENGQYECACCVCGNRFTGHKGRVLCKPCDEESRKPLYPRLTLWRRCHGLGDWHCLLSERDMEERKRSIYQTLVEDEPELGLPWKCSPSSWLWAKCNHKTEAEARACKHFKGRG